MSYPAFRTAAAIAVCSKEGCVTMDARSVARLTDTSSTPAAARIAFSTRQTQDAQVIPAIPMFSRRGSDPVGLSIGSWVAVLVSAVVDMRDLVVAVPDYGDRASHHGKVKAQMPKQSWPNWPLFVEWPAKPLTLPQWQASSCGLSKAMEKPNASLQSIRNELRPLRSGSDEGGQNYRLRREG